MPCFDRVILADWSATRALSPARPAPKVIWLGETTAAGRATTCHRSRSQAEAALSLGMASAKTRGGTLLIGFDFPLGYPAGFAHAVKADSARIKDEAQARLLSRAPFARSQTDQPATLLDTPAIAREQGWILGAGHSSALEAAP